MSLLVYTGEFFENIGSCCGIYKSKFGVYRWGEVKFWGIPKPKDKLQTKSRCSKFEKCSAQFYRFSIDKEHATRDYSVR